MPTGGSRSPTPSWQFWKYLSDSSSNYYHYSTRSFFPPSLLFSPLLTSSNLHTTQTDTQSHIVTQLASFNVQKCPLELFFKTLPYHKYLPFYVPLTDPIKLGKYEFVTVWLVPPVREQQEGSTLLLLSLPLNPLRGGGSRSCHKQVPSSSFPLPPALILPPPFLPFHLSYILREIWEHTYTVRTVSLFACAATS